MEEGAGFAPRDPPPRCATRRIKKKAAETSSFDDDGQQHPRPQGEVGAADPGDSVKEESSERSGPSGCGGATERGGCGGVD
uniref:Uncharacterized protein n=1 Tax=Oryza rufipogon TaxID=4529 RepID=A0A0E0P7I0_ORYRU